MKLQLGLCLLSVSLKLCFCFPTTSSEDALIEKANFEILKDTRTYEDDGSYTFDFETSNGIKRSETGVIKKKGGPVVSQGAISYMMPNGQMFHLTYIADENGYRPQSNFLPVAPVFPHPIPLFVQRQIEKAKLEDEARERMEKAEKEGKSLLEKTDEEKPQEIVASPSEVEDDTGKPAQEPTVDKSPTGTVSAKHIPDTEPVDDMESETEHAMEPADAMESELEEAMEPADTDSEMKEAPENDQVIEVEPEPEVSEGPENMNVDQMSKSEGLTNELKGKTHVKLLKINAKLLKMNEIAGSASPAREEDTPEAKVDETPKIAENLKSKKSDSKSDV